MRLKRIHVNQHIIRRNRTTGEREPVLTVKDGKTNRYASTVAIMHGGVEVARVVYRPDKPLSCGAVCWIETREDVELDSSS